MKPLVNCGADIERVMNQLVPGSSDDADDHGSHDEDDDHAGHDHKRRRRRRETSHGDHDHDDHSKSKVCIQSIIHDQSALFCLCVLNLAVT